MVNSNIFNILIASAFIIANTFAIVPVNDSIQNYLVSNEEEPDPVARAIACGTAGCEGGEKLCAQVSGQAEFSIYGFVGGSVEITYYCYMEE